MLSWGRSQGPGVLSHHPVPSASFCRSTNITLYWKKKKKSCFDTVGNSHSSQWFQAGQTLLQQSRRESSCLLYGWERYICDDMQCPLCTRCNSACSFQIVPKILCQHCCRASVVSYLVNLRPTEMFSLVSSSFLCGVQVVCLMFYVLSTHGYRCKPIPMMSFSL